jgi:hypothetical protein
MKPERRRSTGKPFTCALSPPFPNRLRFTWSETQIELAKSKSSQYVWTLGRLVGGPRRVRRAYLIGDRPRTRPSDKQIRTRLGHQSAIDSGGLERRRSYSKKLTGRSLKTEPRDLVERVFGKAGPEGFSHFCIGSSAHVQHPRRRREIGDRL